MDAKYKVGEKVRFKYWEEGIVEGTVFGTYQVKGERSYSIRLGSTFYTVNEDKILERVNE
jgi:hypothetical protein